MIKSTLMGIAILGLATGSLVAGEPSTAPSENEAAVLEAVDDFYAALNALFTGDVEPMKAVWSQADDVTYMGPMGGLEVGWDRVAAIWEEQAALKLGGRVDPADMHVTVGHDIAVIINYERGENTPDASGETEKVSIRATNTFRKEDGKWKMIGHHTDLLPYLEK